MQILVCFYLMIELPDSFWPISALRSMEKSAETFYSVKSKLRPKYSLYNRNAISYFKTYGLQHGNALELIGWLIDSYFR